MRLIVFTLTILLCCQCRPQNDNKDVGAVQISEEIPITKDSVSLLRKMLIGKWQSTEDNRWIMEFKEDTIFSIIDGQKEFDFLSSLKINENKVILIRKNKDILDSSYIFMNDRSSLELENITTGRLFFFIRY